ncbi:hypothetical protein SEA_EUNOIA_52 [Arthrobacter phage Eunoia]|uniref:Uncharacterized protein n=1 Tax=Arthrobacter phage Eunoia TaxID=2499002 RepID=A0A3S9UBQ7_9CAUD|nr:hypothetical protein SEA_EUNOIA_52 [Arthrobacter phage Eunoia]
MNESIATAIKAQMEEVQAELSEVHEREGFEPPLTTGAIFLNVRTNRIWFQIQDQSYGTTLWVSKHERHAASGVTAGGLLYVRFD